MSEEQISSELYQQVPEDFPHPPNTGAIPGDGIRLSMVKYENKFYTPGDTPPERHERWLICEDMAQQIAAKCIETKAGKRAHMSKEDIVEQYYDRLLLTGWVDQKEGRWIMLLSAKIIDWPLPEKLKQLGD